MSRNFEAANGLQVSDGISHDGEKAIATTEVRLESRHSGPLPSPATLAAYEKACPGLADRITTMAEKDGDHRREVNLMVIRSEIGLRQAGQRIGFSLALVLMVGGFTLVLAGIPVIGVASLVTAIASAVVSGLSKFFEERRANQEREKETPADPAPAPRPRLPSGGSEKRASRKKKT